MSGSDKSVSRSGSGGTRGDSCVFSFETTLASPDPDAVLEIQTGEVLDVEKIDSPVRGVVARIIGGPILGAITRDIVKLRRCIDERHQYEAEVIRVNGGAVTVVVRSL